MSAFISYSHHDRSLARRLSRVLTEFGLEHWWDDALALSTPWNAVLEQRLRSASSIVVLWTPKSSNSEWVQREARMGADASKLVQLRFGEARLPAEMQMSGQIKLYDELRLGSRHSVDEERYYELLEYLSDAKGERAP